MPILGVIASSKYSFSLGFQFGPDYGTNSPYNLAASWNMSYGNGVYLFQSTKDQKIYTSTDATNFTAVATVPNNFDSQTEIAFDSGTGLFWNIGTNSSGASYIYYVYTSTNGVTWTQYTVTLSGGGTNPSFSGFWKGKGKLSGYYYVPGYDYTNGKGGLWYASSLTGTWTWNGTIYSYLNWGYKSNGSYILATGNNQTTVGWLSNPSSSWGYQSLSVTNGVATGYSGSRMFCERTSGIQYATSNSSGWTAVTTPQAWSAVAGNGTNCIGAGWYTSNYGYSTNNGSSWTTSSLTITGPGQLNTSFAGSYFWLCDNSNALYRISPGSPGTATALTVAPYNRSNIESTNWGVSNGSGITLFGGYVRGTGYPIVVKLVNNTTSSVTTPAGLTNSNGAGYQSSWDGTNFWFVPYYTNQARYSTDGSSWTSVTVGTNATVAQSNGTYLYSYAQGSGSVSILTISTSSYTNVSFGYGLWWSALDSSSNFWAAYDKPVSGSNAYIAYIPNGSTTPTELTVPTRNTSDYWFGQSVYSFNNKNFLVANNNGTFYSKDGAINSGNPWVLRTSPFPDSSWYFAFGGGRYFAYSSDKMYYSSDLSTWTLVTDYPVDNWALSINSGNAGSGLVYNGTKLAFTNASSTQIYVQK